MASERLQKFLAAEWSFIGVVVFFITHGYSLNLSLVPLPEIFLLMTVLLVSATIFYFLCKWALKSSRKASLFTSFLCFVVLFFSVYQDFLDSFQITAQLSKLRFLVPFSLLASIIVFILLKRSKIGFQRAFVYLNLLILIYIVIDLATIVFGLAIRIDNKQEIVKKYGFTNCNDCSKPSVYLIILDAYFGSEGLRKYHNYDNSAFEDHLRREKFHVNRNTNSNYKNTLFSMASMLNMEYLPPVSGAYHYRNYNAFSVASEMVMENKVCAFFESQGYTFNNLSSTEIKQAAAASDSDLWPDNIRLITRQTMFYKISKYLPAMLERNKWISPVKGEQKLLTSMDKLMQTMLHQVKDSAQPSFTYLHLMMPHYPYIFDSAGIKWRDKKLSPGANKFNTDNRSLQYQVFVNKKIAAYISELKRLTGGKAIILLMSDHGYQNSGVKDKSLPYSNLNAVYLPDGSYGGWYDGISNVNQFRVLFNAQFRQKMPILVDSIGD